MTKKKENPLVKRLCMSGIHKDTDIVLKSIPNPFGSFEKATYVIFRYKSKSQILYSFTTTCRNTEDCIEVMKDKFKSINGYTLNPAMYCTIYKVQYGVMKLIFRDIL